jgi:endonuclease I
MKTIYAAVASALLVASLNVEATPPSSFSTTKSIAEQQVHHDQDESFNCGGNPEA